MSGKSGILASNQVISVQVNNNSNSTSNPPISQEVKQEIGQLMVLLDQKYLGQISGCGASHVPASEDPYAIPYGLHLH